MKSLSITSLFILLCTLSCFGQQSPSILSNMTSVELEELTPKTGTMVYNTTVDAIYYYGNNGWFALSGECVPKPVSPNIDSAYVSQNRLFVYFSPVNSLVDYLVEEGGTKLLGTVKASPAIFSVSESPQFITVRASSKCGNSGPVQLFPVKLIPDQ